MHSLPHSSGEIWEQILSHLADQADALSLLAWFEDVQILWFTGTLFLLGTTSAFRRDLLRRRHIPMIRNALQELYQIRPIIIVLGPGDLPP